MILPKSFSVFMIAITVGAISAAFLTQYILQSLLPLLAECLSLTKLTTYLLKMLNLP